MSEQMMIKSVMAVHDRDIYDPENPENLLVEKIVIPEKAVVNKVVNGRILTVTVNGASRNLTIDDYSYSLLNL